MRDCHLLESISASGIARPLVECDRSFAGVENHAAISAAARPGLRKIDQGPADSAPLQFRHNGQLPHANVTFVRREKHKASDQTIAIVAGQMVRVLFGLQFLCREPKAERFAEDRVPQIPPWPSIRQNRVQLREMSDAGSLDSQIPSAAP